MSGQAESPSLRVGCCEDDGQIREVLRQALTGAGHETTFAFDGGEAIRLFVGRQLDVLVLDIGLPDADGREVCQSLRAMGQRAPVLFLTALDALPDVLRGFHAGGADYLVKPFRVAELLVRVAALGRRESEAMHRDGAIRLDPARHALVGAVAERTLTPTEFRLAAALMGRPGEVLRRAELVSLAWTPGALVHGNTLDAYLHRVRKHLQALDPDARIETVRGVGFVWRPGPV